MNDEDFEIDGETITLTQEDVVFDGTMGDCMLGTSLANSDGVITINSGSLTNSWINVEPYLKQNVSVNIGDVDDNKHKIYIVEPWQSRNPVKVQNGLWVSLENDLISNDELKQRILDKLDEVRPDVIVKLGINPDNIKLVKSEVNLEINKE